MPLIPLWVKALILAGLLAAAYGMYSHWRSGIVQEGYDNAVAEYEPKLKAAEGKAKEWETATGNWQRAHEAIRLKVEAQNIAARHASAVAEAKHDSVKKALEAEMAKNSKAKDSAIRLSDAIRGMTLPKEECDALYAIIDDARAGGL